MMERLPSELLYIVCEYLTPDIDSLSALGHVSARLREISGENKFWKPSMMELYTRQLGLAEHEIAAITSHRDMYYEQMRLFHDMPRMVVKASSSRERRLEALVDIARHGPFATMPLQEVVMKGKGLFSHQYYAVHCLNSIQNCRCMHALQRIAQNPASHTVLDLLSAFHNFNTLRKEQTVDLPELFSVPLGLMLLQRDGMDMKLPVTQRAWLLAHHFSLPQPDGCRTKVDLMTDTSLKSLSDVSLLGLYAWYGKEYCNIEVSLVVLPFQTFARIEDPAQEDGGCFFLDVTSTSSPLISKTALIQKCIDHNMEITDHLLKPSSVTTVANALVRDAMVNARSTIVPQLVANAQQKSSTNVPKLADSFLRLMTVKILFGTDRTEVQDATWCAAYIISNMWYQRPNMLETVYQMSPEYARHLVLDHFGVLKTKLVPEYKDLGAYANEKLKPMSQSGQYRVGQTVLHKPSQCACIVVHRSDNHYILYSELDGLISSAVTDFTPSTHMVALGYDKVGEYFAGYDWDNNVYIPGVDLAIYYPNDYTSPQSTSHGQTIVQPPPTPSAVIV
ncbi:hypothetical protein TRICI_000776 [Trichomonascus ciferrii]|uniref:F-box domain-containing protein n=1 Tax=Trichomonascus ciferrii TaxID=44093 RepID=A0A642VCY7_9ASCO|nr:hypothetical protein TRICI_000776 [Trichomonascus ciferrii]